VKPLLLAAFLAGCAAMRSPPVALIFEDSSAPLEYRAGTARSEREVQGESCRNSLGLPYFWLGGRDLIGWGDAGYRDAMAKAQEKAPGASLSDVRADLHLINVLVFRRTCLVVTAAAR
jgi:hypothetical protein